MSIRTALVALFVFGALAFARPAEAQIWSHPVCMDPSSIPGLFSAMDFSGTEKCESHCKYTGNLCKSFAKDAAGCNKTDSNGYWTLFGKIECDTQPTFAERLACKAFMNDMKKRAQDARALTVKADAIPANRG